MADGLPTTRSYSEPQQRDSSAELRRTPRRRYRNSPRVIGAIVRAGIVVAALAVASVALMYLLRPVTGGWLSALLLGDVLMVTIGSWTYSVLSSEDGWGRGKG
jgi:hypothetical protein